MAIQELPVFCRTRTLDEITENDNIRTLEPEELEFGWVRKQTVTTQQINSALNLLSHHTSPSPFSPYLHHSASGSIPAVAIEWVDGGTIVEADSPELFAYYGNTFPALGTPPTGWVYIVRNH